MVTALSVTQLAGLIQQTLNREPDLKGLWVRGEITNLKRHSSGHLYFSLKDKETVVRAVMFRGNAEKLRLQPKDGQDCFVRGYVALYARETQIQFCVEEIEAAGLGSEALALEELRKKLGALGYFDPTAKKKLPLLPQAVGVISSPTGAVIQDIKKVVWRRYPGMPILLYPSAVQGREAVDSLVRGFAAMAEAPVSVVILARGGGSAEDLAAFNREEIVEALHCCPKPVISAVGHETDVTLADLAADLRAATPSMAAELAVPIREELLANLNNLRDRLTSGLLRELRLRRERLTRLENSYVLTQPMRMVDSHRERLSRCQEKVKERMEGILLECQNRLKHEVIRLEALSPLATLARGYSICRNESGQVVYQFSQVIPDQRILVALSKGGLSCKVLEVKTDNGSAN